MSAVPSGWATVAIGDVVSLKTGPFGSALHKSDYVDGGVPLINPSHIRNGRLVPDPSVSVDAAAMSRLSEYRLQKSDVVMGRRGEMGRCAVVPATAAGWLCGTGSVIVRPRLAILAPFLQRFLSAPATVEKLNGDSVGSTMVNLNQSVLLGLTLDLPPLVEQQRIADKLDTVLARVDACRDRLARIAPLLKRFRQSVLAAASSGRLTEDWRGRSAMSWAPATVESLCASKSDGPFGSHLKSDDYVDEGARVVRLENIGHLTFDRSKETFISMEKYSSLRRHKLQKGDLLFSSFVDEEVRVCAFPGDLGTPAINKADCFCLRVNPSACDPAFLMYRLACKTTYLALKEQVHGATRPRVNLGQLRRFELSLPCGEEQAEIVRRVETLFAFADRLEARLAQAQTAVDRLTPSLLAKAFRGELVPQDPADEPAAELLKRLAASRATPAPKTRKGRQAQTA